MYVRNFTGYYSDKIYSRVRITRYNSIKITCRFAALFSIADSVPTHRWDRVIYSEGKPREKNLISQPRRRLATLRVELAQQQRSDRLEIAI